MNGWINLYKPKGVSSARALSVIKRAFPGVKVGHAGTLDLEAEGVLPVALGEATKLTSVLVDAKKTYRFTVKFGEKRDTADSSGEVTERCDYIPTKQECEDITDSFLGSVKQVPPSYSALKIKGQRAYKLARQGQNVELKPRYINIYELSCVDYDFELGEASFVCCCSKGTYIRTLAEDIALSLQSLGYVVELLRLKVGFFEREQAISAKNLTDITLEEVREKLRVSCLKVESVLDDIPVIEADEESVKKIRFGQAASFDSQDLEKLWVKDGLGNIVAIGSLHQGDFKPSRVFNIK